MDLLDSLRYHKKKKKKKKKKGNEIQCYLRNVICFPFFFFHKVECLIGLP
jgi:hypothetical protein